MTKQKSKPLKVHRENVSQIEIAKYYLEVEFSKLFKNVATEQIVETISNLPDSKVWALTEAISFTYHLNGVFYKLAREGYVWREEVWKVEELLFTGMDPNINKLIFSEDIKGDAVKLKNYLLNYYSSHSTEDPEGLFSYRPTGRTISYQKLLVTAKEDKIALLDGSHRLVEMLLNEVKEVHVYAGHPVEGIPEDTKRTLVGKSVLILMTILYKIGSAEEKQAVRTVVTQLINKTIDARDATRQYWVERSYNEEIKNVGEELLKESEASASSQ